MNIGTAPQMSLINLVQYWHVHPIKLEKCNLKDYFDDSGRNFSGSYRDLI